MTNNPVEILLEINHNIVHNLYLVFNYGNRMLKILKVLSAPAEASWMIRSSVERPAVPVTGRNFNRFTVKWWAWLKRIRKELDQLLFYYFSINKWNLWLRLAMRVHWGEFSAGKLFHEWREMCPLSCPIAMR